MTYEKFIKFIGTISDCAQLFTIYKFLLTFTRMNNRIFNRYVRSG